jgi:hypothetical protein
MKRADYTTQAEVLFGRFAERHGLSCTITPNAPVEVLWTFPEQPKLSMPITLGLQNLDELNFGVSDFWSYFFPFQAVADKFERAIDAWVYGDARIAVGRGRGRKLQLREGDNWTTIYSANGCLLPLPSRPMRFEMNQPVGIR